MSVGIFNYNALPGAVWPSDVISRFETLSYEKCEKISSYAGKAISTFRCILNMLARSQFLEGTGVSNCMSAVAKKAKIFSVLSIPFSPSRIQSSLQKAIKSIDIDDHEGALVNSLGLAAVSAGTLDSLSTFTNAFRDIIGMRSIQILTHVGLPVGFFIAGIDISSRGMQLSKAFKLYQEIDPSTFLREEAISRADLRRRMQRRLGIRQESKSLKRLSSATQSCMQKLEQRKDAKLSRLVPKNAQTDVDQLFDWLNTNEKQPMTKKQRELVAGALQKIRTDLEKQMAEDTLVMVALLVGAVGLTFFCVQGMGCLPYIAQMISSMIKANAGPCVKSLLNVSPESLIGKEA